MSSKLPLLLFAFGLAVFTQFSHMTAVPGLHFDEAWQGLFANRIATEPGFWPFEAMNAYTTPFTHYLLAAMFKLFGPSLFVMRGTLGLLNLASLALIASGLWRAGHQRAAWVFTFLWALLPLSIHDHRFYIEVTAFHGFCFALMFTAATLFRTRPRMAGVLAATGLIAGTWSHIAFVAVWLSSLLVAHAFAQERMKDRRVRILVRVVNLALVPLAIRMGIALGKPMPFLLAAILIALSFRTEAIPHAAKIVKFLSILALPLFAAFSLLHLDGLWPYAQATGTLPGFWVPANLVLVAFVFFLERAQGKASVDRATLAFTFMQVLLLSTMAIVLKPSPRFFMVSAIAAMLWIALRLETLRAPKLKPLLFASFGLWNLLAFELHYIVQFERHGAQDKPVQILFVKDSARDFRPYQKAWVWAVSQNCQKTLAWVEDDRFKRPIEFLALTTPAPRGECRWKKDDLFFSHIPNLDQLSDIPRTAENTPPPTPQVKLLAHSPQWGDLAFWIR